MTSKERIVIEQVVEAVRQQLSIIAPSLEWLRSVNGLQGELNALTDIQIATSKIRQFVKRLEEELL